MSKNKNKKVSNNTVKSCIYLKIWTLAILSSILLSIPFLLPHSGWVALFAFIPLFSAEHLASEYKKKYFFICYYIAFVLWNLSTTFWIYLATPPGAIAAILLNSLQMAIIFALFRSMKKLTKGFLPYLFFIFLYLAWEHLYFTWDINWPWLTLGNSFANSIKSIQWYEYTGTLGGSLWILLVNALIFRAILLYTKGERFIVSAISVIVLIISPIILSLIIYSNYKEQQFEPSSSKEKQGMREFLIVQPNIDPYNDKFSGMSQEQQDNIFINLFKMNVNKNTFMVIAPETFVSPSYYAAPLTENNPIENESFRNLRQTLLETNANVGSSCSMIFGAVTDYIYYKPNKELYINKPSIQIDKLIPPSQTARHMGEDIWKDRYNSAVYIGNNNKIEFYHKSKLVILAESTPSFLKYFSIDLGGMIGNYGTSKEINIFTTKDSVKVGTAICYESIFGDYYRDYILKGANLMTIITNDGWWKDTPGHRQHLSYASLRAIETRRSIARCANTGISALINQRGDIVAQTAWWEQVVLQGDLKLNNKITIFVKYGDIIGRVSCFISILFFLMFISRKISKKRIVFNS